MRGTAGRLLAVGVVALSTPGAFATDAVDFWNNHLLDAIRVAGGAPTPISRIQAIFNASMYDAMMNIENTHKTYAVFAPAAAGTSKEAAMAMAAHTVLMEYYPSMSAAWDTALNERLALVTDGKAKNDGMALGLHCADKMIMLRASDGADGPMDYTPGNNAGDWRPTPPDFSDPPFTPAWGLVTPFAMTHGSQFRPDGPGGFTNMTDLLQSQLYADMFNEVKSLGAKDSVTRTQDQTEAAFFWANDVDGTYKPPGHLNNITREVADQQGLTESEKMRLVALASIAMADAGIAAWDSKYLTDIDLWRPITGIHEADDDGNALTISDPTWEPLNPFSPPFPAWVSGHATFGSTHAAVMAAFFGTDNIAFTISSEDPFYADLFGGGPVADRMFASFTEAAIENWRSRIYLGVHWDFDGSQGFEIGQALGAYVFDNFMQVPAPGAGALLLAGAGVLASRRRRA